VPQQTLHTARLDLVPLTDEHLADEAALDADPEVMHFVGGARTPEKAVAGHRRRMDRGRQVDGLGFWAGLLRHEPGRPFAGWWVLGPTTGPDQPDWRAHPDVAELGYRLHRAHWRQGLATEGSGALLEHGFADVGLRRVIAQADADNLASRGVMESLGMTHARTWPTEDDDPTHEVEYVMTRHAWFASRLT